MKNKILIGVVVLVLICGAFYAGTSYAKTKKTLDKESFQNTKNSDGSTRQGMGINSGNRTMNQNGEMSSGEIISKDDKSITLKLRDGGSKIIFFSGSTEITKSVSTTSSDLINGKTVMVSGTKNSDGSVSAKTIQLRDEAMPSIPKDKQQKNK